MAYMYIIEVDVHLWAGEGCLPIMPVASRAAEQFPHHSFGLGFGLGSVLIRFRVRVRISVRVRIRVTG